MAKLSQETIDYFRKETVAGLENGQVGYTTPWGIHQDDVGDLYIHEDWCCYPQPGGTVELPIRLALDSNGDRYIVVNQDIFRQVARSMPPTIGKSTAVGANSLALMGWLPVAWEGTVEIEPDLPRSAAKCLFEMARRRNT